MTVYAQWTEQGVFVINFVSNGGTDVSPRIIREGENAGLRAESERPGFVLIDWYTDDFIFERKFDFTATVTANHTLYTLWDLPGHGGRDDSSPATALLVHDAVTLNKVGRTTNDTA